MIPSERLKGIEAFVCVADAGSFTAAADRLSLTASAVGKSVARLEARLRTRLFERSTRRLALTDAGRAYYRTCVRVLADLQDAEAVLAAERQEPAGRWCGGTDQASAGSTSAMWCSSSSIDRCSVSRATSASSSRTRRRRLTTS